MKTVKRLRISALALAIVLLVAISTPLFAQSTQPDSDQAQVPQLAEGGVNWSGAGYGGGHCIGGCALMEAAESDRRSGGTGDARPLEGLPVSIKDAMLTANVRTTDGMSIMTVEMEGRSHPVLAAPADVEERR